MDRDIDDKSDNSPDSKKALQTVFRLLKIRPRSEKEINDRLRKKHFTQPVIAYTLTYLKRHHLIDDNAFAHEWIEARLRKPFGSNRIRYELIEKGIKPELIQQNLAAILSHHDEEASLKELAIKQKKKYRNIDMDTSRRKLYGYLIRRGFPKENILRTIHELLKDHDR